MEARKNNKGLVVIIVVLIVLLLGAVGYICYDKFFVSNDDSNNESVSNDVSSEFANELLDSLIVGDTELYFKKNTSIKNIDDDSVISYAADYYIANKLSDDVDYRSLVIPKDELDKIVLDTFYTTKNYNSPMIFTNFGMYGYDNKDSSYHFQRVIVDGRFFHSYSKLVKAEKDDNNVYIYSKAMRCDITLISEDEASCHSLFGDSFVDSEKDSSIIAVSSEVSTNEEEKNIKEVNKDYVFDTYGDKLDTYKTTFKLDEDNNYRWYSFEIVK